MADAMSELRDATAVSLASARNSQSHSGLLRPARAPGMPPQIGLEMPARSFSIHVRRPCELAS